jgi:hypothetical protein
MSRLSTFFHGSDTHFGVFYPERYLVAMFDSYLEAELARRRLRDLWGCDEEAIAVPGEDVVEFAEEHWRKDGILGLLMTQLSRAIGTEAVYADRDLERARQGAALLAVHCRTPRAKMAAWQCLEAAHPAAARYYSAGGIEHFAGET